MVNTRRMEINGSHSGPNYHTRGTSKIKVEEQESGSSSAQESDDSEDLPLNRRRTLPGRQPQKESEDSEDLPLSTRRSRRPPRKVIEDVLPRQYKRQFKVDRRSYYSRPLNEDMDIDDNTEEEVYHHRSRRSRHLVKKNRMLKRSALSLRPIRQKSYADHSPIHFDSDSDGEIVKRSKRVRKPSKNMSWLTDSQMHKVGYPNLHAGYSEEDSRDAIDGHGNIQISQRVTRYSNRRRGVYYEEDDFDDPPEIKTARVVTREFRPRREPRRQVSNNHAPVNRRDHADLSNDKENKEEQHYRTRSSRHEEEEQPYRTRSSRHDEISIKKEEKNDDVEENEEEGVKKTKESVEEGNEKPIQNGTGSVHEDKKEAQSSASEEEEPENPSPRRTRRQSRRILVEEQFTSRQKVLRSDSSESEEEEVERKKYSLRNRPPKQAPKAMQTRVLRGTNRMAGIRSRRKRRRRRPSSSSSSDSTSSDCRPTSKQSKSPHSKNEKMKSGAGGSNKIMPIKPETLDASIRFNSIGGLDSHIQCLKEMILLPMMYPEVFRQFQMQPPKGVLFHGPPGTGKTLIARALANECSFGTRKVSFFMRKGADLLSKWIGESEKQLRILFEQASAMKPSIIFFDELDGLAPVRSSRQDQVHASIVSTLLALMDGLDDRGNVIVIGATNRIDAIDPALRRPGRFDRELFFPLPSRTEREEILKVHIASWAKPPSPELLSYLAENTVGYCGSDLRALCSEAVIQSFRRTYPQVYESEHRLLLEPETVKVEKVDFMRAKSMLVPASQRISQGLGRKLLPILEPILQSSVRRVLTLIEHQFPHGLNVSLAKVKLSANMRAGHILLTGDGPQNGQTTHVAPALLFKMEHIHSYLLDLATLFSEAGRSPEEACIQVFNEARRNIPSIVYIPNIDHWWDLVSDTVKAILVSQLSKIDPNMPFLLLATANSVYSKLDKGIQNLFSYYRKEIYEVRPPNADARKQFFKPLLVDAALRPPKTERERIKTPPPLPRAPTPPPAPLTEAQAKKVYETEEHTLRELRIFLRDMCKKLANNKLFYMFTKPVDTDEVPDYPEIIKQPMDLETMMTKVDFHRYECAKDFLNDIELICQNALEYNPARSSADKQIRHRACSLRDYAYTLIKTEMDSDFEEKCQDIKTKRRTRKACVSKYLPPYINTPEMKEHLLETSVNNQEEPSGSIPDTSKLNENISERRTSPIRKRKISRWQKGYLMKKKKPKLDQSQSSQSSQKSPPKDKQSSDESKENDPDSSTMETPVKSQQKPDNSEKHTRQCASNDVTSPLTINCDTQMTDSHCQSSKSAKRRLTDLLSPSQLLDSPLYFDDIEQALSESANTYSEKQVECSPIELEKLLEQTVKVTDGFTLSSLLDLYNSFTAIVRKYSKTSVRTMLAKELTKELLRFKKSMSSSENGTYCTSKSTVQ